MDPLAHSLFGAALSRTALGRAGRGSGMAGPPIPGATATLVVAANLPDVDVLAYLAGGDAALAWRRGWTHGPVGLLVLPLVWLGALWLVRRWRGGSAGDAASAFSPRLVALAYLGILSHPALDWMNTYGVRFLLPFDRRWYYGDVLFIVDPWMWLLLGAASLLGAVRSTRSRRAWLALAGVTTVPVWLAVSAGGRVSWALGLVAVALLERRVPPGDRAEQRLATLLVGLFGLYLAAMVLSTFAARRAVLSELDRAGVGPVEELMVGPLPGTPFSREIVAVTPRELRFGTFRWGRAERVTLDPRRWPRLSEVVDRAPVVARALEDPCVAGFVEWMRFPSAEIEELPDGAVVHLLDLRYTRERGAAFGAADVRVSDSGATGRARSPLPP